MIETWECCAEETCSTYIVPFDDPYVSVPLFMEVTGTKTGMSASVCSSSCTASQ